MISLWNSQIREYAEEQVGTSFLRWRLLRICGFHWVFVAPQTTKNTQKRIFGLCQPHICSRLPLLTTALSSKKVPKFSQRYNCLTKKINTMAAQPPVVWACPACSYAENVQALCANCAKRRGPGFRIRFCLSKKFNPPCSRSRHAKQAHLDTKMKMRQAHLDHEKMKMRSSLL